ncbi:MAG: S1-like domain-containing RNA-binding protein [Methylococcales bacterium]
MNIGTINNLQVIKQVEFGVYLDGGEFGEILLPKRYVPDHLSVEDNIDVFIYNDSEDRLIATTETPLAMVGECAWLRVKDVNRVGAFLDWGLPKDLLVPYNEQYSPMEVGKYYPVCVLLDNETNRIAASSKLYQFLEEQSDDLTPQQAVDLLIIQRTDLGFKAVINHTHLGLLFHSDVFQNLKTGQKIKGYIKDIRDDGKINLCLQLPTQEKREELSETILDYLKQNGGSSTLTDKSPPEEIYEQFKVSKSNYKKALGSLYRQRIISIDKQKITLLDENNH